MKSIFLLSLILLFIGCNDDQNPSIKKLQVYSNAQISDTFPFVESGNGTVFHFYFKKADEEHIADDEFAEDFFIQLTDDKEFEVSNEELQNLIHIYQQYCFCGPLNYSKIISGSLEGQKRNDGKWKIEGDVTLELGYQNEITKEIDWSFEKELNLTGTYSSSSIPTE